jgi:hypothetical protein
LILNAERVGQGCVLASPAFERIAHPSFDADGRRTPALRFGDPRVMALAGALCTTLFAATGITNKSLRALMTGILGTPYSTGQMTYDLRRLRLDGVIRRIPHTNRYVLTDDGIRFAIFYTKIYKRLLRPLLAADQRQAPAELRDALKTISHHVNDCRRTRTLPQRLTRLCHSVVFARGLVRPVGVVVIGVLGQDMTQMPLPDNQHPVGALPACTADPSSGDRVRPRCPERCRDDPDADRGEHRIEGHPLRGRPRPQPEGRFALELNNQRPEERDGDFVIDRRAWSP